MGLISDFFICDAASMPAYAESESFPDKDSCEYKYITPLEAGGLLAAILGTGTALEMMGGFTLQTPEDAEHWTMIVPPQMRDALLALDDSAIPNVAARCPDFIDSLDYTQDDYESLIGDLRKLARRARDNGKEMYLWNCL